MHDLGIVIVNWNTCDYLKRCLETVLASEGDFTYRVIVVDNASTDSSPDMVRRDFPTVELIASPTNGGYPYGNNLGLRVLGYHGAGDVTPDAPRYALLLNPDTELPPDALYDMLTFVDSRPDVGVAGPKLILEDGSLDLACRRSFPTPTVSLYRFSGLSKLFPHHPRFGRYNMTFVDPDQEIEVDSVVGAYMQIRREAIEAVGLLDESFFMYGEDLDWAFRIKEAGWKVLYHPQVMVKHIKRAASRQSKKAQFEFQRAMLIFYRKHYQATTPLVAPQPGDGRSASEGRAQPSARDTGAAHVPAINLNPATTSRRKRDHALLGGLLIFLDVTLLTASFMLGYWARANLPFFQIPPQQPDFYRYVPTMILHVLIIESMFYLSRLYHLPRVVSRIDHARKVIGIVTVGALLAWALPDFLFKTTDFDVDYPRVMFFYVWIFSTSLVIMGREFFQSVRNQLRQHGVGRDNLLIVGNGKVARDITKKINAQPWLGYNIVGVVVNGKTKTRGTVAGKAIIGTYHDLPTLIDTQSVEQVIIALPDAQRAEIVELITLCQRGRVDIKIYPDMFAYMAGDLNVDDLGGTPLITVRDIALRGWRLSLKRGLDVIGSVFGLIFLSPFMLLTALLIRLESKGPTFYTQERMGLDGRPFHVIKFRTMQEDAEVDGPGWTVKDDPRVTRLGRWMRKSNWDEIPQLINVALGEMSLVGPRPERPVYVLEFRDQIPRYMERHREKAGMTGWAQVNGLRGDTSIAERTSYDLWYVENWSLWLDIVIIIRTIWNTIMHRDKNAY